MFWTRLISGIVLVVLALIAVTSSGSILFFTTAIISLIGMYELYRILNIHRRLPGFVGYLAVIVYYGLLWFHCKEYLELLLIGSLMLGMAVYVFTFPTYNMEQIITGFFGVFYVAVMLSYLYQVRTMPDGLYVTGLIFISSWGCDTCAYCVGVLFGKHKLAPKLSPKKSVEGAVGGVAGAALLGFLYSLAFGSKMIGVGNPQAACVLACAIAAAISQVGDLAASGIKRNHNVKDYGNLIPGHGGILDRFDSMLFTAPAIYFAMTFLR